MRQVQSGTHNSIKRIRVKMPGSRARIGAQLVRWRRRHLNVRTVVVVVVLAALLAPEAATIVDAAL